MPRFAANLTMLFNEHPFLDRFEVQLGGLARETSPHSPSPPKLAAFTAPSAEAEVRQVAHLVRVAQKDAVGECAAAVD